MALGTKPALGSNQESRGTLHPSAPPEISCPRWVCVCVSMSMCVLAYACAYVYVCVLFVGVCMSFVCESYLCFNPRGSPTTTPRGRGEAEGRIWKEIRGRGEAEGRIWKEIRGGGRKEGGRKQGAHEASHLFSINL